MAKSAAKEIFDGANLSPRLKPKGDDADSLSLPIGKSVGPAGKKVARAYKHAAAKSSTYAPEVVDMIYHMSREGRFTDEHTLEFVESKLAAERDMPHETPAATWDQLVFLSANLTRLVIDPYREKCNSRVVVGELRPQPLELDWPLLIGGADFPRLGEHVLPCLINAANHASIAVCGHADWPMRDAHKRLIVVDATQPLPDLSNAHAVEITAPAADRIDRATIAAVIESIRSQTDHRIPVGIVAPACDAVRIIDRTIALEPDFYVADAQWTVNERPTCAAPEMLGAPALHVLADVVERIRDHNREADVQVIYRGGIRGGADAGKAICLGATAVCLGLSAVIGLGHRITALKDEADLIKQLSKPIDADEAADSAYKFAKSANTEVTMLARACGKSSVTNMEPEDLRALTIAVSAATGVPVTGKDLNFRPMLR